MSSVFLGGTSSVVDTEQASFYLNAGILYTTLCGLIAFFTNSRRLSRPGWIYRRVRAAPSPISARVDLQEDVGVHPPLFQQEISTQL